jgi:regulator of protease activity HflC (stomatin/prohibitin superfamily)
MLLFQFSFGIGLIIVVLAALFAMSVRILREYERGVVFQLGRFWAVKGPGLILLIPVLQQMVRVDLRTIVHDVPKQDVITRDNVSVRVSAVLYFRVIDPARSIIQVANFFEATSQLAQTTLRSVLGSTSWTRCWPSAKSSISTSSRCSTRRPTPGASRWPTSKSSTSTWTNRWCGRSRARPRPSASGAPR